MNHRVDRVYGRDLLTVYVRYTAVVHGGTAGLEGRRHGRVSQAGEAITVERRRQHARQRLARQERIPRFRLRQRRISG